MDWNSFPPNGRTDRNSARRCFCPIRIKRHQGHGKYNYRMPRRNSYEITSTTSNTGNSSSDFVTNATLTVLSQKRNAGLALYASHRRRDPYDHNADNFSELPLLTNNSFGFNSFLNLSEKQKLQLSFSSMYEYRYGGEITDEPAYLAQQAEERTHNYSYGRGRL